MENTLPTIYLFVLLVLLSGAGWAVIRQVIKTRNVESALSQLER
jgi:hypothetical protein